jgi:hypothetical protein
VVDVDDSSAIFGISALVAFADDAVAVLLLFWLDFLEAGRKVVRFFFVDLDPRGISETPGSGMLLLILIWWVHKIGQ